VLFLLKKNFFYLFLNFLKKKKSEDNSWPYNIKFMIGKFLLENILMKSCYIPVSLNNNRSKYDFIFEFLFEYCLISFESF